jgi:acetylornithine deacetylase/succinyl-diaminopimelate desuccinylase-like protein
MTADTDVAAEPRPLSSAQRDWLDRATAEIDPARLAQLDLDLTRIPSPTGEEREIAEFITVYLRRAGLDAQYQPIDPQQGNAIGRIRGKGDGPVLLLYAPTDTMFAGREDEDLPWLGPSLDRAHTTDAFLEDGNIVGQGAENPKGFATCVISAAEAVLRAGVPLRGDVVVGLGAGGMPTNRRPSLERYSAGQGSGCSFMLEQGIRGDFAIIAKPGYAVAWEEVGICWFKVQVRGTAAYVGTRHTIPYKNAIAEAAQVITGLEEWFPEYTARNTSGLVAPQGHVGAIEGGWTYKPSFAPAACNLYIDLRLSPRTDPMDAKRQFGAALARIQAKHPHLDLDWDMILSIPGGHTDPKNWIVQSLIRAWEFREGQPHVPRRGTSGATDAAILRGRGIPTARLGMPRAETPPAYRAFGMGICNVQSMKRLTECLVYSIVDTCTRDRAEVGLG